MSSSSSLIDLSVFPEFSAPPSAPPAQYTAPESPNLLQRDDYRPSAGPSGSNSLSPLAPPSPRKTTLGLSAATVAGALQQQIAYPNGDSYLGQMKKGQRHGAGVFVASAGTTFEGVWEKDEISRATVTYTATAMPQHWLLDPLMRRGTQLVYRGEVKNLQRHGNGALIDVRTNTTVADGVWHNDQTLQGTCFCSSGQWRGLFLQAQADGVTSVVPVGKVSYFDNSGTLRGAGLLNKGQFHGEVTFFRVGGDRLFEGNVNMGVPHGQGLLSGVADSGTNASLWRYDGAWAGGFMDGACVLTTREGVLTGKCEPHWDYNLRANQELAWFEVSGKFKMAEAVVRGKLTSSFYSIARFGDNPLEILSELTWTFQKMDAKALLRQAVRRGPAGASKPESAAESMMQTERETRIRQGYQHMRFLHTAATPTHRRAEVCTAADEALILPNFAQADKESLRGLLGNTFKSWAGVPITCADLIRMTYFVAYNAAAGEMGTVYEREARGSDVARLAAAFEQLGREAFTFAKSSIPQSLIKSPLSEQLRGRLLDWAARDADFISRCVLVKTIWERSAQGGEKAQKRRLDTLERICSMPVEKIGNLRRKINTFFAEEALRSESSRAPEDKRQLAEANKSIGLECAWENQVWHPSDEEFFASYEESLLAFLRAV